MTSIINDDNFNTFNSSKVIPIHPRTERVDKCIIPSNNWIAMSLSQFKHWFNDCKGTKFLCLSLSVKPQIINTIKFLLM